MARDTTNNIPIENKQQLVDHLAAGCKSKEEWRIGTEHEKFGFYIDDLSPVPFEGDRGISAILHKLQEKVGWEAIEDDGNLIGLYDNIGGGAISLEPGGQFELSGAPVKNLHETCQEANSHLKELKEICDPMGIGFLGVGASPKWRFNETPRMPKSRYRIMTDYMPKVGRYGHDMMYRTATIQVNLDYASEHDMAQKFRLAFALQPLATALFANSPFLENKPNGFLSYRSECWRDTDNNRAGMLPFVFEESFGFERYVDYALDVPMYFLKRGDNYHDVTGQSFRDLLAGNLEGHKGEKATIGDWDNHLSTIFPEARLKRFIEMRGADGGPWNRICALPAFWVGLLYDQGAMDEASALTKDWNADDLQQLRDAVPKQGLKASIYGRSLMDIGKEILSISEKGLKARNQMNQDGRYDETFYLNAIKEVIESGKSPADILLDHFENDWQHSVDPLFREYAY